MPPAVTTGPLAAALRLWQLNGEDLDFAASRSARARAPTIAAIAQSDAISFYSAEVLLSEEAAELDRPKAAAIAFDRPGAAVEHLFAPAGKLDKFIRYLDSLASGNGQLELLELEDAFRRLRSECVTAAKQADGAKHMEQLLATIAAQGLTLRKWFSEACARASNGEESTLSFEHFKVPRSADRLARARAFEASSTVPPSRRMRSKNSPPSKRTHSVMPSSSRSSDSSTLMRTSNFLLMSSRLLHIVPTAQRMPSLLLSTASCSSASRITCRPTGCACRICTTPSTRITRATFRASSFVRS